MLCESFKFVSFNVFEKYPVKERDGRVGSGRAGPGWFMTDMSSIHENKSILSDICGNSSYHM